MFKLKKIKECTYEIPQDGSMLVPGLVIASAEMLENEEIQKPLEQVRNVAHLPGIVGYSIAMPDIHWGYGFPIGGVAATDSKEGVISPGGVGYDINCGVRLAVTPLKYKELSAKQKEKLLDVIYHNIPSGVGRGHKEHSLSEKDYQALLEQGAQWSVNKGWGLPIDLEHTESHGCIEGADFDAVSQEAKARGRNQLGSIGSGNHFVEIGEVQKLFRPEIAQAWGIEEGQLYILIHSGSRGFGHQVCQDTLNVFIKQGYAKNLPDPQLVAVPIRSSLGQRYFSAMAAAANFAFNNRQQILHEIREAFFSLFQVPHDQIRLIYDVCHNIAKFETYIIDGEKKTLCVHRKGATRAFGKGHPELAPIFQSTGQPVLVPGDMGRASHLLVGLGNPLTWCSCCHGAGRARSRHESLRAWKGQNPITHMKSEGVLVKATSSKTLSEEMPDAYKDVDLVVEAVEEAGLANRVARLRPGLAVKG